MKCKISKLLAGVQVIINTCLSTKGKIQEQKNERKTHGFSDKNFNSKVEAEGNTTIEL